MACNFIKKRFQPRCFPVKFAKFLRTPILKNICERIPLQVLLNRLNLEICIITRLFLSRILVLNISNVMKSKFSRDERCLKPMVITSYRFNAKRPKMVRHTFKILRSMQNCLFCRMTILGSYALRC